MTTPTDTPRTDAHLQDNPNLWATGDFARALERECAELRKALEAAKDSLSYIGDRGQSQSVTKRCLGECAKLAAAKARRALTAQPQPEKI